MTVYTVKAAESTFSNHCCPLSQGNIHDEIIQHRKVLHLPYIFAAIPVATTSPTIHQKNWVLYKVEHLNRQLTTANLKTTDLTAKIGAKATKIYYLLSNTLCPNHFTVIAELQPSDSEEKKALILSKTLLLYRAFHSTSLTDRIKYQRELFQVHFGGQLFWQHFIKRQALSFFLNEYIIGLGNSGGLLTLLLEFDALVARDGKRVLLYHKDPKQLFSLINSTVEKCANEPLALASSVGLALSYQMRYRDWAFALLRNAIQASPHDATPYVLFSALLLHRNAALPPLIIAEGQKSLEKAYLLTPEDPSVQTLLAKTYFDGSLNFPKDMELAKVHGERAVMLNPHSISAHQLLGDLHSLGSEKNLQRSQECFEKAALLHPNNGELYFIWGLRLFQSDTKRTAEAVQCFEKALSFGYKSATLYSMLGAIYCNGTNGHPQNPTRGVTFLVEALKKNGIRDKSLLSNLYRILGCTYLQKLEDSEGNKHLAVDSFTHITELQVNVNDCIYAYTQLATIYYSSVKGIAKDLDKALQYAQTATKLSPESIDPHILLGKIYFYGAAGILKDIGLARLHFEKAQQLLAASEHKATNGYQAAKLHIQKYINAINATEKQ